MGRPVPARALAKLLLMGILCFCEHHTLPQKATKRHTVEVDLLHQKRSRPGAPGDGLSRMSLNRVGRLLVVGLMVLIPLGCQGRMIHPAPRYVAGVVALLPAQIQPIVYRTSEGAQTSFSFVPSGPVPEHLWLVCSGNASYALAWPELLAEYGDPQAGYLLLDYPGYGVNEGAGSPRALQDAAAAAVEAWRLHLGISRAELDRRMGVLGHSLGAAAALQYAALHPVQRIIVAAPFTTMVAMGHHVLFWPCGYLIWHRYDNVARLEDIARQVPRPSLTIVHGDADTVIPVTMSAELAEPWPEWAHRQVIHGRTHNNIAVDAVTLTNGAR